MYLAVVRDSFKDVRPKWELFESVSECNCASESSDATVDWVDSDLLNLIDLAPKLLLDFRVQNCAM